MSDKAHVLDAEVAGRAEGKAGKARANCRATAEKGVAVTARRRQGQGKAGGRAQRQGKARQGWPKACQGNAKPMANVKASKARIVTSGKVGLQCKQDDGLLRLRYLKAKKARRNKKAWAADMLKARRRQGQACKAGRKALAKADKPMSQEGKAMGKADAWQG